MPEMTIEQATDILNAFVIDINKRCGGVVIGAFRSRDQVVMDSYLTPITDSVSIALREMPNCVNHVLERTIRANNQLIDLINDTNQKLEELKKELKHG